MKNHIIPATILTVCCILFFSGAYTLAVWGIAQFATNSGEGEVIQYGNGRYGFANVGQSFTEDQYFWSRPSAVGYNAAGSAGSNKGPSNPEYLAQVQARIDTLEAHNPGVDKKQIPVDLITASGSGLDPHLSLPAVLIQVPRIARIRHVSEEQIKALINENTESSYIFGPTTVNILKLNVALDGKFKHLN